MKVLVTGGAGYIGSVFVDDLVEKGHEVTVYDNLSTGFKESVNSKAKLIIGCLGNREKVFQTIHKERPHAVVHFAGLVRVDESMEHPMRYFDHNCIFAKNLLDVCVKEKVKKFVFSSTAATYGVPVQVPISEEHIQNPINPYGESKLLFEKMLKWYQEIYGLNAVIFRYFNASGATADRGQKQKLMSHLIPNVLKVAAKKKEKCLVFGNDFSTRDGTGIRDYIHVKDLSQAHIQAIGSQVNGIFNLGIGKGYSVLEVIKTCEEVTQETINYEYRPRREGDAAEVVADSRRAQKKLDWMPTNSSLRNIIETAWNWHCENSTFSHH